MNFKHLLTYMRLRNRRDVKLDSKCDQALKSTALNILQNTSTHVEI